MGPGQGQPVRCREGGIASPCFSLLLFLALLHFEPALPCSLWPSEQQCFHQHDSCMIHGRVCKEASTGAANKLSKVAGKDHSQGRPKRAPITETKLRLTKIYSTSCYEAGGWCMSCQACKDKEGPGTACSLQRRVYCISVKPSSISCSRSSLLLPCNGWLSEKMCSFDLACRRTCLCAGCLCCSS